jgi:hypothetical protein
MTTSSADFNFIPKFSIDLAEGFYQVGYQLAKFIHNEKSYNGFVGLAPAVVNFNLAAELYIKSIFAIQFKRRILGHKLLKLYRELPASVKSQLERIYDESKKTRKKELTSFRITITPAHINTDGPKEPKVYNTISDLLLNHQDAFEDWRSLHEIGKKDNIDYEYDFHSMDCFINGIKTYMHSISNKK